MERRETRIFMTHMHFVVQQALKAFLPRQYIPQTVCFLVSKLSLIKPGSSSMHDVFNLSTILAVYHYGSIALQSFFYCITLTHTIVLSPLAA